MPIPVQDTTSDDVDRECGNEPSLFEGNHRLDLIFLGLMSIGVLFGEIDGPSR